MKKFFMVLLFILVVAMVVLASPSGYSAIGETMYVSVKDNTWLNGRAEPNMQANIECHFSDKDTVTVLDMADGWAKVQEGGEAPFSYVKWDYLTASLDGPHPMQVASNGRVRIRNNPNGKEIVGYAENGDVVNVAFFFSGWAKTDKGWINTDYLSEQQ